MLVMATIDILLQIVAPAFQLRNAGSRLSEKTIDTRDLVLGVLKICLQLPYFLFASDDPCMHVTIFLRILRPVTADTQPLACNPNAFRRNERLARSELLPQCQCVAHGLRNAYSLQ